MALGRAFSVAVCGLDGKIVEIEADITSGLPGVHLVGLPDAALQESRDRVRAAVTNCGNNWPMARLTLALSPATLDPRPDSETLIGVALDVSAHGPGFLILVAVLWPVFYWLFSHRAWFLARGNPERHDA